MHGGGFEPLRPEQGRAHRAFGGIHVIFQQRRRESQGVADVVEPIGRRVRRKVVRGADIDAEQIADRVVVLGAVEPARADTSRVGLDQAVLPRKLGLQPAGDGS